MTTDIKTALSWCPSWSTPGKPFAVLISVVTQRGILVVGIAYGCPYFKDPAIFHLLLKYYKWKIVYSLLSICLCASQYGLPVRSRCLFSWEYLWKDSWGLPMRAKSLKQRCPALCLLDLSYNVKYHWSCRVDGCYSHLTASGSWHGFPGVDHEGHQDSAVMNCCWKTVQ